MPMIIISENYRNTEMIGIASEEGAVAGRPWEKN